jgi:hypothetical protein
VQKPNFANIVADINTAVANPGASQSGSLPHDYVVYGDNLKGTDGLAGTAQFWWGSSAETTNSTLHNAGGLVATVWAPNVSALDSTPYSQPETMMHEMIHTLGSVQASAPHNTGYDGSGNLVGHCNDQNDIMCYSDGGTTGSAARVGDS